MFHPLFDHQVTNFQRISNNDNNNDDGGHTIIIIIIIIIIQPTRKMDSGRLFGMCVYRSLCLIQSIVLFNRPILNISYTILGMYIKTNKPPWHVNRRTVRWTILGENTGGGTVCAATTSFRRVNDSSPPRTVVMQSHPFISDTWLSDCLSGCLSVCLYVCLSVCLAACLSVCLSVYLSGWLTDRLSDRLRSKWFINDELIH